MITKLLNRSLFYCPVIIIGLFHMLTLENFSFNSNSNLISLIVTSFFAALLFYEVIYYLKYLINKNKTIAARNLESPSPDVTSSDYFFNLKIKPSTSELEIFDGISLILYLNKTKKVVNIYGSLRKTQLNLSQLDFLVYEFKSYHLYKFGSDYGKRKWYCDFSLKLKDSDKLIYLFSLKSERDNLKEIGEHNKIDTDDFYFSLGKKIASILSENFKIKYLTYK